MKEFTKIDIPHATHCGIAGVSVNFYSLIDRLQEHSERKHPERKWTNDTYYGIAFQWIGKEKELENVLKQLEQR